MQHSKAIMVGTIFTPTERIDNGVIVIKGHRIHEVGRQEEIKIPSGIPTIDNRDRVIVPGFIDMHIHGAAGHDLMEGTMESVSSVSSYLARHGTTSYLATTATASIDRTLHAAKKLGEIIREFNKSQSSFKKYTGAEPIGIHLEGPFINVKKRGAHPASKLKKPSISLLKRFLNAAGGTVRVLTLAPELDGALAVLEFATSKGLRVGIGHSNATYEEAERSITAGATHAAHIYNAMRPFLHRDPGIIGAILTDRRISAELICDGIHVDKSAIQLLVLSKGIDKLLLVTDSLSGAGMPDGNYRLGNFTVHVAGGVCRTIEGNLAGSTVTLDAAIRNLSSFTGLKYEQCLVAATINPARLLGLEKQKGSIVKGADADLVVLDRSFFVTQTYVRGQPAL